MTIKRCAWVGENKPHYEQYHDKEWGVPVHDDIKHFEMLTLEGAQAGLSWETILRRRQGYARAFKRFNPKSVANMTDADLEALMKDTSIIRNKLKIYSVRKNAQIFLAIQKEFGSFDKYVWSFVKGKTIKRRPAKMSDIRQHTDESDALAKDLKKRGMKFAGTKIMYAYMQAIGMVDEHMKGCFRAI